jgi:hypothetical protein
MAVGIDRYEQRLKELGLRMNPFEWGSWQFETDSLLRQLFAARQNYAKVVVPTTAGDDSMSALACPHKHIVTTAPPHSGLTTYLNRMSAYWRHSTHREAQIIDSATVESLALPVPLSGGRIAQWQGFAWLDGLLAMCFPQVQTCVTPEMTRARDKKSVDKWVKRLISWGSLLGGTAAAPVLLLVDGPSTESKHDLFRSTWLHILDEMHRIETMLLALALPVKGSLNLTDRFLRVENPKISWDPVPLTELIVNRIKFCTDPGSSQRELGWLNPDPEHLNLQAIRARFIHPFFTERDGTYNLYLIFSKLSEYFGPGYLGLVREPEPEVLPARDRPEHPGLPENADPDDPTS